MGRKQLRKQAIYFQKSAEKLTNAMLQHLRLNATIIAMKRSVLCSSKQYSTSLVNRKEKRSLLFSPLRKEMKMSVVDTCLKNL